MGGVDFIVEAMGCGVEAGCGGFEKAVVAMGKGVWHLRVEGGGKQDEHECQEG